MAEFSSSKRLGHADMVKHLHIDRCGCKEINVAPLSLARCIVVSFRLIIRPFKIFNLCFPECWRVEAGS